MYSRMKKIKRLGFTALFALPILWVACEDIVPGDDLNAPVILEGSSSNATRTTVTLTGNFQGINSKVKEMGVVYSTSSGFPEDKSKTKTVEKGTGNNVSVTLENLTPNEQYYYYWYVSSGKTEVRGVTEMFKTASTSAPIFRESVVDSLDENVIRVKTSIQEVGNNCLLECGLEYRKKIEGAKFIPVECEALPTNDTLGYSVMITELEADTEYEIRPYAKSADSEEAANGTMEGYGEIITSRTLDKVSPVVQTKEVLNVGISAATLVGVIESIPVEGSEVTEKGFCMSRESNNPTVYDSTLVVTDATELKKDYLYQLTNLEYNTTYYIRAYAKNTVNGSERVGYGSTMQFTTSQMITPEVEFGYWDETNQMRHTVEMTSSSAKCYATLNNLETSVLKERGFIWSEDNSNIELEEARKKNNVVTAEGTNSIFSATIEDLTPNKYYYIRAYAIYQSGDITNIGYSGSVHEYTSSRKYPEFRDITIDTDAATAISFPVSSGITKTGDGEITEYGFVWHTNSDCTLENCIGYSKVESESMDEFDYVIENLKPTQGYHVRVYVKVKFQDTEDVYYSGSWYHYTRAIATPRFYDIVVDNDSVTTSVIPASVVVEDFGDGEVKEAGFIWGENSEVKLENCKGKQINEGTDYKNLKAKFTNLEFDKNHYIKAYMTMEYNGETNTYYSGWTNIWTKNIPSIGFYGIQTESSYGWIAVKTGVEIPEGMTVKEKGFLWTNSDTEYPTIEKHDGMSVVTDGTLTQFTDTIKGLKPNSSYSITSYLKVEYDGREIIKTGNFSTTSTWNINSPSFEQFTQVSSTMNSVTVKGKITASDMGTIKEKGFIWKKDDSNVNLENCDGRVKLDAGLEEIQTTIENLTPRINYYVKMYTISDYEGEEFVHYGGYMYCRTSDLMFEVKESNVRNTTADIKVYVTPDVLPKEYEEIGYFYTDNRDQSFEEVANKVKVTLTDTNEFTMSLSNLKELTTYYWGMYIKQNGVYYDYREYEFKTKRKPDMGDIESPGITN